MALVHVYMRISENHNSLGCEQPLGLDVNQSLNAQDAFSHVHVHVYMNVHMQCVPNVRRCYMYIYMTRTKQGKDIHPE